MLMQFVGGCYKTIDDGMQVDAIYTGIKAFDGVLHSILLEKHSSDLIDSDYDRLW